MPVRTASMPGPVSAHSSSGRSRPGLRLAVLIAVLAVTAAFAVATRDIYDHNETRLLDLRVRELGLVLQAAVGTTRRR